VSPEGAKDTTHRARGEDEEKPPNLSLNPENHRNHAIFKILSIGQNDTIRNCCLWPKPASLASKYPEKPRTILKMTSW